MKLILQRRMLKNGALMGTLSVEHRNEYGRLSGIEKICDTIERKNGQLPTGEYRVVIGKCKCFARQMIFLEPVMDEEDDSSSSSSLPLPEICERCRLERKHHEFGCMEELHALSCPMLQPGNGPFRLRKGGILIGEAHAPGFVLRSQELFLQLFDRVKKAMGRGSEVVVAIE